MRVMIVSDSHAMDKEKLLTILKTPQEIDYYIHCGDIFMTYDTLALANFYIVKGNNDFGAVPKERQLTIDNQSFFITHGHLYDVNFGIDVLVNKAKSINATIVCFGHTHQPFLKVEDDILCINPGSLLFPRGNYREPTYCILDTNTLAVVFYNANTHTPCNPFTTTKRKAFSFTSLFKR